MASKSKSKVKKEIQDLSYYVRTTRANDRTDGYNFHQRNDTIYTESDSESKFTMTEQQKGDLVQPEQQQARYQGGNHFNALREMMRMQLEERKLEAEARKAEVEANRAARVAESEVRRAVEKEAIELQQARWEVEDTRMADAKTAEAKRAESQDAPRKEHLGWQPSQR